MPVEEDAPRRNCTDPPSTLFSPLSTGRSPAVVQFEVWEVCRVKIFTNDMCILVLMTPTQLTCISGFAICGAVLNTCKTLTWHLSAISWSVMSTNTPPQLSSLTYTVKIFYIQSDCTHNKPTWRMISPSNMLGTSLNAAQIAGIKSFRLPRKRTGLTLSTMCTSTVFSSLIMHTASVTATVNKPRAGGRY